jgi:hypothetical protein
MKLIIGFFIFCLVLFIYLHIQFHLKTSEDLEIYEIDDASKDKLEEIFDLRQPVLFNFDCDKIILSSNRKYILDNYHAFEIKIRNTKDTDTNSELYIPLPLHTSLKLFNEDKQSQYFTENNYDFLQETGVGKNLKYNDEYLRPYMISNCNYDIMFGSNGTETPFRYEINYRNFFLCTQDNVQIKLAPPKSIKYLYPCYDYENFEFRTPVNPWNVQPKYSADFDKIKCLEFTLQKGKTVFIPAYWWYSIKFNNNSSLACFKYRTYMNNLAISPYIAMHSLQIQNIKRNIVKKVSINELNNTEFVYDNVEINDNIHQNFIDSTPKLDNFIPEPSSFTNEITGTEINT